MAIVFSNNARTTLASNISNSATTITVADGSVFPSLTGGDIFYCTIDDGTNNEIVEVTAISSNTLTVVRAQDNTTARAFVTGDLIELRLVAKVLETFPQVETGEVTADEFIGDLRGAVIFKAKAGEAVSKGDAVYVSGISGTTPVVALADADFTSKMPAFGLVLTTASLNGSTEVVTFGTISGVDTSAFSVGDTLYVSTTAGELTNSKPTGEASLLQNIGKVQRSHASSGSIKVGGAGRTNDTPNLNDGNIFIGNASNQTTTASLNTKIEGYLDANGLTLPDSVEATFGTQGDAGIYHNGTHLFIDEKDAGRIFIRSSDEIRLNKYTGEFMVRAIADGAVTLYHDNSPKIATTSSGIDVTGTISSGDITISDATPTLKFTDTDNNYDATIAGLSGSLVLKADSGAEFGTETIQFHTGATERLRIDASGNIKHGASQTTIIDSSRNLTNIGTISSGQITITQTHPTLFLQTSGGTTNDAAYLQKYNNDLYLYNKESAGSLFLGTNNGTKVTINSSGNATFAGTISSADIEITSTNRDMLHLKRNSSNGDSGINFENTSGNLAQAYAMSTGDFVVDATGNIILDADGGDVKLNDNGAETLRYSNSANGPQFFSPVSDKDIIFKGNDGGSTITALTLDMSEAGAATFNSSISSTGADFSSTIEVNASSSYAIVDNGSVGWSYSPQESGAASIRYFLLFNYDNNASFPYLTNRTPNGSIRIYSGTAAGGGENEKIRINGGDGTTDVTFRNSQLNIGAVTSTGSSFLSGSQRIVSDGYIATQAIYNYGETGSAPAAIVFGDGATYGSDQISLITSGVTALYINGSQNATFSGTINSGTITVTGDVMPAAENAHKIGSASVRWEDLYVDDGFIRNAYIDEYIYHTSDTDTNLRFQTDRATLTSGGGASVDAHSNGNLYLTGTTVQVYGNYNSSGTINSGAITSTGEVEATALDINGNGDISGNLTLGGYLAGPATFTIDPAAVGDNTGTVVIAGNLQVDGTTTTVNSTTVNVSDKAITLGYDATTDAANNQAGIVVYRPETSNAQFLWNETNERFEINRKLNISQQFTVDASGTNDTMVEIGAGTTSNHYAYIDLIGDATYTDYGLRIIRNNSGANSSAFIYHRGTGNFNIETQDSAVIKLRTAGADALTLDTSQNTILGGNLSIGGTSTNSSYGVWLQNNKWYATQYSSAHDVVRMNANTAGGLDIYNQTDSAFAVIRTGGVNIGTTQVIDGSANLTNIGTISSGVITSTGASSGRYTGLEVVNSTNAGGTETAIGLGVVSASNTACDVKLVANRVAANSGSDFYIEQTDSSGSQQETFRITESGNATFAGTISSGDITITSSGTIGGSTVANAYLTLTDGSNTLAFDPNEIHATENLYLLAEAGNIVFRDTSNAGVILKNGNTQFMDTSLNLSNIGTISSGAITSTGNVTAPGLILDGTGAASYDAQLKHITRGNGQAQDSAVDSAQDIYLAYHPSSYVDLAANQTYSTATQVSQTFTIGETSGSRWYAKVKMYDPQGVNEPVVTVNDGTEHQLRYENAINGSATDDSNVWTVVDITDDVVDGSNTIKVYLKSGQKAYFIALYVFSSGGLHLPNEPYELPVYSDQGFGVEDQLIITKARNIQNIGTISADATASNSAPKYTFTGDPDTGLGYIGANSIGLISGGSRKFYINSTTAYFQNLSSGVIIDGNLHAGDGTDIDMDASSNGQLEVDGNGYQGAIALNGSAMHIYHNSSSRDLVLGTNETARLTIGGAGGFNFNSNNLTSVGTINSGAITSSGASTFSNTVNIDRTLYLDARYDGGSGDDVLAFKDSLGNYSIRQNVNDGNGNYSISLGYSGAGSGQYAVTNDGVGKILFGGHGRDGAISLNAAPTGTAGNNISFSIGLLVDGSDNTIRVGASANGTGMDTAAGTKVFDASGNAFATSYSVGANEVISNTRVGTFPSINLDDQIISTGDTNTYMQFHAADQWRVVTGGQERLEVNNTRTAINNGYLQITGSDSHLVPTTTATASTVRLGKTASTRSAVVFDTSSTGTTGTARIYTIENAAGDRLRIGNPDHPEALAINNEGSVSSSGDFVSDGLTIGSWGVGSNTGQGRIGKASDRNAGTITNQIGGGSSGYWEIVDYAWSTVVAQCNNSGDFTAYRDFNTNTGGYEVNNTSVISSGRVLQNIAKIVGNSDSGGTTTFNVGRGDVYFENNGNSNANGAGITLRTSSNPTANTDGCIFDVRSSGQAARLWVGQDLTSAGYNNFYVGRQVVGGEGTPANYKIELNSTSGDITATGNVTAYGSVSDIRQKENIEQIDKPIERLEKIKGITFNYKKKTEDERLMGVIAQDLLEDDILKLAVYEQEDFKAEDDDPLKHTYGVRYEHLTAILIEAVKEQQEQIKSLKSEINNLKGER